MQFYTLFQLQKDLDSNLHGGGVSGLQDFYSVVDKGRRSMIGKIRPAELIRKGYLEQALYPNVDRYAIPEDIKYKDVIEIGLLSGYRNVDTMNQPLELVTRRRFDQKRNTANNSMYIGYENGIKYAKILNPLGIAQNLNQNECDTQETNGIGYKLIHNCDSLSDNGTWNTGGNVINVREDKLLHVIGSGSIKFDIDSSGTSGYIENFTLEDFDLDDFRAKGAVFTWFNFPIPQNITSVRITLGSNTDDLLTDLYQSTVANPHDSNQWTLNWNLVKYMFNSMSTIGTPNPKALKYIRFDFTTNGQAIPNCNMDNILSRKGMVYEIVYNSSYCLIDPITKTWKKVGDGLGDIIVAEDDTYNILLWETTLSAQKELYGNSMGAESDVDGIQNQLAYAYQTYFKEHPSEALLTQDSSHIFGNIYDGYSDDTMYGFGGKIY